MKTTTGGTRKKVAVGYVRVSTDKQADEGVSLDAQEAKIRAWAEFNGYDLLAIEVDAGISAKRADNRPGLLAALDTACAAKAALVVYSLSRLSRSLIDTLAIATRIDKSGADLVSLSEQIDTTSAAGRMMFKMLAVLNEYQREVIGENTREGMAQKRAQGFKLGGDVPYGFRLADAETGRLEDQPAEQEVIAVAKALRGEGLSLARVAEALAERGMAPRNGGRWFPMQVKRLTEGGGAA
jgi:DNA invertase Pin-like site-specific DNA recombinase